MAKNFLYMFITLSIRLFSNTIIFFLLAKLWGVEGFGIFMYPYTLTTLLALIVDYGFSLKVIKDISEFPNNVSKIINEAVFSKIILTVITFIILIIILLINNFSTKEQIFIAVLLLISNILNSYSTLFNLPFRALEFFKYETFISLISNIVYSTLIIILILLEANQILVSFGIVLSKLFTLIISIYLYKKKIQQTKVEFIFNIKSILKNLSDNFPYAIHLIVGSLYFQVDTLIVYHFLGNEGVGLYQSAMRIITGALVLIEVNNGIFFPKLGGSKNSKRTFLNYSVQMNVFSHFIGLGLFTGLFFMSEKIIMFLYGAEFKDVIPILKGLSILLFIRYAGSASGLLLTVADKQKVRAIAAVFSLVSNLLLNYFLIPIYGLYGAVYAGIITAIFLNIIYLINTYYVLKSFLLDKTIVLISLFWIFMIIINLQFRDNMILNYIMFLFVYMCILCFVLRHLNLISFLIKRRD
jgi:O-antigen/teichoic acid export membrane protein